MDDGGRGGGGGGWGVGIRDLWSDTVQGYGWRLKWRMLSTGQVNHLHIKDAPVYFEAEGRQKGRESGTHHSELLLEPFISFCN